MAERRVIVIGGGIAGLAAAIELAADRDHADGGDAMTFAAVELREAETRLGGKIRTSPFAGVAGVDEGADAYLLRAPHASGLAATVGVDEVVHPTAATAAVWHDELHEIPGGIVLGVPAALAPFVTTSLLSWRGKARAAIEPLLPRVDTDDALGPLVRRRFGHEVHERLVDALVGSIYAADTDRWSIAAVPQLAALASEHRSLLLGARGMRRTASNGPAAPIFGAPAAGMGALVDAAAEFARAAGVTITNGRPVAELRLVDGGWRVDDEYFDAVVLATPAAVAARLLADAVPEAAGELRSIESADVIMVRALIPDWPARLAGRSGYLVPKPVQRYVTAASFGSQKWAHWEPPHGGQILRVSLGRDRLAVMHLDDDAVVDAVIDEVGQHLGLDLQPSEISITRWPDAFPQYRPHHHELVERAQRRLPDGLALAGASFHGIGIPACVASGQSAARLVRGTLPGTR